MNEFELIPKKITNEDNTLNVEMSEDEIGFIKHLLKKHKPKKIVEVGVSAGGNTVNLLHWKDKDSELFSIDLATKWYRDDVKLSGWMADELITKDNWIIYRGCDYFDVYEEIGKDIDFIIIDTVHFMPGEFLTFLAALPQLKDGCIVVLHDIHLNILRSSWTERKESDIAAHCTGLLFGGVSSNRKWSLKSSNISNIGAFVVDKSTRNNIKDIFHILCSEWRHFPFELNLNEYSQYIYENYSKECYNLFNACLDAQSKYFNVNRDYIVSQTARVDIFNENNKKNNIKFLNSSKFVDIDFPDWFSTDKGNGAIIQTNEKSFDLKFKCINKGLLKITLRGPDVRDDDGNRVNSYVDFKTLKINGKNIIKDSEIVCCYDPFIFEKKVANGEIIKMHVEWKLYSSSSRNINTL